jgi:hypothetical protein
MAVTQYIGARYVPVFADPAEWSSTKQYEPLTIVLYQGNSFTSKQFVPIGIDINDTNYWVETGNYNAQVEQYRQSVLRLAEELGTLTNEFSDYSELTTEKIDNLQLFNPKATLTPYMQTEIDTERYPQGGCIIGNSVCFGAYHSNTITPAYVYLESLANGATIAMNTQNAFGHCNDMCFNDDKNVIVVAGTDTGQGTYKIYELNPDTLYVSREYTPDVSIYSICYNKDKKVYYGIGGSYLYTLTETFEVVESAEIQTGFTFQGIAYNSGYIFVLDSGSNSIDIFKPNGYLIEKIPIEYRSQVLELEFCDFKNGTLYIGMASQSEPFMCLYTTEVFKQNYKYNDEYTSKTFYISYDSEGLGYGTQDIPAKCISAVDGIPCPQGVTYTVYGTTKFTNLYGSLGSASKRLTLNGNATFNKAIDIYNNRYSVIEGHTFNEQLTLISCDIKVRNCTFKYAGNQSSDAAIRYYDSVGTCTNSTFDCPYTIALNNSEVAIRNNTFTTTVRGGVITDVVRSQPINTTLLNEEFGLPDSVSIPNIKAYRLFEIEIRDTSDNVVFKAVGMLTPNNPDTITMYTVYVAPSGNVRFFTGYIRIASNMICSIASETAYFKGKPNSGAEFVRSTDYVIKRIVGVA